MEVMDTQSGGLIHSLHGEERLECIVEAIDKFRPHLLVCAGWSLETDKNLDHLRIDPRVKQWKGYAIVEVQKSSATCLDPALPHRMYVLKPEGNVESLGPQLFARSSEMNGELGEGRNTLLLDYKEEKTFRAGYLTISCLCCGELNAIRGREEPKYVCRDVGEWLDKADIILNPTHDRMGNPGTLDKKRKFLSRQGLGGRPRAYISVSNWNSRPVSKSPDRRPKPRQNPDQPYLHTVYLNGHRREDLKSRTTDPSRRYEYREINLEVF